MGVDVQMRVLNLMYNQFSTLQWNLQQGTRWGQYKFTSFVLCRELVLFLEVVSVLGKINFLGPRAVSLVERSFILCPFLGGSTVRGFTIYIFFVGSGCVQLEELLSSVARQLCFPVIVDSAPSMIATAQHQLLELLSEQDGCLIEGLLLSCNITNILKEKYVLPPPGEATPVHCQAQYFLLIVVHKIKALAFH